MFVRQVIIQYFLALGLLLGLTFRSHALEKLSPDFQTKNISNELLFTPEPSDWKADTPPSDSLFNDLDHYNLGFQNKAYWFKYSYDPSQLEESVVLVFDYPLLDYIDLYLVSGDQIYQQKSGDMRKFASRSGDYRLINFRLPQFKSPVDVYFRVQTSSSYQVGLSLFRESIFEDLRARSNVFLGLYYGSLIILVAYNLFIFLFLREKSYLSYSGFLASYVFFQASINGIFFQYAANNEPEISNLLLPSSVGFFAFFLSNFMIDYLYIENKGFGGRSLYWIRRLMPLCCILALLIPYEYTIKFVALFAIYFPIFTIEIAIKCLKNRVASAGYFFSAFGIFITGTGVYGLKTVGLLPANFWTEYSMQMGSVGQALILSVGLASRIDRMRKDNAALNEELKGEVEVKTKLLEELEQGVKAREKLANDLILQSEQLADESKKRAEAEKSLRLELESKFSLFADATHHLNNPLNHVVGANESLRMDLSRLESYFFQLVGNDESDPDVFEARKYIGGRFRELNDHSKTIKHGVQRAADSLQVLRVISGLDGNALNPTDLKNIMDVFSSRVTLPIDENSIRELDAHGHLRLLGHPAIYAQALEMIVKAIWKDTHRPVSFHFKAAKPGEVRHKLEFRLFHRKETQSLEAVHDQVTYLLKAYDADLSPDSEESFNWCLSVQAA